MENGRASMLMKGSSKRNCTKAEMEEVKQEHAEMLAFLQNE